LIIEAKAALPHGEFEAMVARDLPFGPQTARKLMAIARDSRVTNRAHARVLPPSWTTLYELTKFDDEQFAASVADGTIRPDVERSEILAVRQENRRAGLKAAYEDRKAEGCTIGDLHKLAAEGARFGSIVADPNWHYQTYSAKGQGRSADQHYDTDSLEAIKALPVAQLAAADSVLHVWCMDWLLPGALEVIDAWGFTFIKVGFVWVKQYPGGQGLFMGLGKWTREGAELCLLATKGRPSRLAADVRQVLLAPIAEHSRKPDEVLDRIERLTIGPYLELYARRQRPGWTCWGDEIPRREFASAPAKRPTLVIDDELEIPAFLKRRPDGSLEHPAPL
jgi:N6-adenosine-specific RNA methylase IME4